jgi:AcrR family transcriptional regulator
MVRHARHDDDRGGRRLGRLLRREAHGERPAFSAEFQARLMRRLEPLAGREVAAEIRPALAAARAGGEAAWRPSWPLAAAVALVVVATGLGLVRREGSPRGPASALPAAVAVSQLPDEVPPGDEELPGIEVLPTFDEIEQGLRDGVRTLAASLVDVPDWASLADFDAASLLGGPEGP